MGKGKGGQAGKGTVEEYYKTGVSYLGCEDLIGTFLVLCARRPAQTSEITLLIFSRSFKMALTAPCGFLQWPLLHRRADEPANYLLGAAAALRSSWRKGLTEKNLWRHGSQRNAGSPRMRPRNAVTPGTCSAEMRCNSWLPQIPQCAYKNVRNGIRRA